jgi:hypothetical protein
LPQGDDYDPFGDLHYFGAKTHDHRMYLKQLMQSTQMMLVANLLCLKSCLVLLDSQNFFCHDDLCEVCAENVDGLTAAIQHRVVPEKQQHGHFQRYDSY